MTETLGFVGLGAMGGPMATRLLNGGFDLCVYDVNATALAPFRDRGVRVAANPKEVADAVETVFVSLPKPQVVEDVALGAEGLAHGAKIKRYVDLSTTGAVMARSVAERLAQRNIESLDCPVSGGVRGAEAGTLALMISGSAHAHDAVKAPLSHIGENSFYLGETPGLGQTMKLANNLLSATATLITSEALVLGTKAGLDPAMMVDIFNVSSGRNDATLNKFPKSVLKRKFEKSMKQELLYKDVDLCLQEADALDVPMWLGSTVRQWLRHALTQGTGDEPSVALIKHLESWAGVTVGKGEQKN